MEQTDKLRHFFAADRWEQSIDRFSHSGYALVDQVNARMPRVVVDLGCGFNPFKGRIRNLIGIDLVNDAADVVCDANGAPFRDGSVDVVLALGSVNFGDREDIIAALETAHRWLAVGGALFMRVNPGEPIGEDIVVFPWTRELAVELGDQVGFDVEDDIVEERLVTSGGVPAKRLFWRYRKR